MIDLNGEKIEIKENSNNPIIKEMYSLWLTIKRDYDLDNGGTLSFVWDKKKFPEKATIHDPKGDFVGSKSITPSMVMFTYNANFTDSKGNPHNIIYYTRKSVGKGGEVNYIQPTDAFLGRMTFGLKDKELIIFMLMFNSDVNSTFEFKEVNLGTQNSNTIIIEDLRVDAKLLLSREDRNAESYMTIKGMEKQNLAEFAKSIGMNVPASLDEQILKTEVLAKVRSDESLYERLLKWNNPSGKVEMKKELSFTETIEKALESKKIGCKVANAKRQVRWYNTDEHDNQLGDIVIFDGTKMDIDQMVEFYKLHLDEYEKIK